MLWKLLLIGLGMVLGDILMKNWIISGGFFRGVPLIIYISAIIVYGISLTGYAYQLRTMNFGIATITPILVNIATISLISFFYYKEVLSVYKVIGILFAFTSIILFSF